MNHSVYKINTAVVGTLYISSAGHNKVCNYTKRNYYETYRLHLCKNEYWKCLRACVELYNINRLFELQKVQAVANINRCGQPTRPDPPARDFGAILQTSTLKLHLS